MSTPHSHPIGGTPRCDGGAGKCSLFWVAMCPAKNPVCLLQKTGRTDIGYCQPPLVHGINSMEKTCEISKGMTVKVQRGKLFYLRKEMVQGGLGRRG